MLIFVTRGARMVVSVLIQFTLDVTSVKVAANNFGRFLFESLSAVVARPFVDTIKYLSKGWMFDISGLGSVIFTSAVLNY